MRFLGAWLVTLTVGCGAPVARNVPAPNKAAAAGIAAGAAAAITLADPKAAAATAESQKTSPEPREQKSGGTVPVDVLDRLDEKQKQPPRRPQSAPPGETEPMPGAEP